jgi:hypothetical protein
MWASTLEITMALVILVTPMALPLLGWLGVSKFNPQLDLNWLRIWVCEI